MDRPWLGSHGPSMGFPWVSHGSPLSFPWVSHESPIGLPWVAHGFMAMSHGPPTGRPWFNVATHKSPMASYFRAMGHAWICHCFAIVHMTRLLWVHRTGPWLAYESPHSFRVLTHGSPTALSPMHGSVSHGVPMGLQKNGDSRTSSLINPRKVKHQLKELCCRPRCARHWSGRTIC